jgi:hypothetical protein
VSASPEEVGLTGGRWVTASICHPLHGGDLGDGSARGIGWGGGVSAGSSSGDAQPEAFGRIPVALEVNPEGGVGEGMGAGDRVGRRRGRVEEEGKGESRENEKRLWSRV